LEVNTTLIRRTYFPHYEADAFLLDETQVAPIRSAEVCGGVADRICGARLFFAVMERVATTNFPAIVTLA
jgi:hypothetical protein